MATAASAGALALKIIGGLLLLIVVAILVLWWVNRGPTIPYEELEKRYANSSSHFVDLHDGLRVHYRDEGNPSGPVLVLIHGFGDNFTSWEGWARTLGDRFRIISLDLPGHGLTRAPDGYVNSAEKYPAIVKALADKLALPKFTLAGNSLGGGITWQTAVAYPELVNAIVLADAAGWPSETLQKPPLAFRLLQSDFGRFVLRNIDNKPLIRSGLRGEVADPASISDAFIDRWAEFQRAPGHRAILLPKEPSTFFNPATPEKLAAIKVPTLILHGEKDTMIGVDSSKKFAAAIPGSKLILYPDAGHLPQIEIPEKSASDTAAFLEASGVIPPKAG